VPVASATGDNRGMTTGPRKPSPRAGRAPRAAAAPHGRVPPKPLGDAEIEELQDLLDAVPAPLEPLDVSMLDGFLCGVLLQPEEIGEARWIRHIIDIDGRPAPTTFDPSRLHAWVRRRHAELADAIARRQWFDPWVFELGGEGPAAANEAVYPWVAGMAAAFEIFPGLMSLPPDATLEPLALLYRHLGADDLEQADELLEEIASLEPVTDLGEAVEGLVRATLLLADAARPLR
jgi:uncharacterized protein